MIGDAVRAEQSQEAFPQCLLEPKKTCRRKQRQDEEGIDMTTEAQPKGHSFCLWAVRVCEIERCMDGWQTSGRSCRMAVENSVPMARAMKKANAYFIQCVFMRGTIKTPVREKALITVTLRRENPHTGGLNEGKIGCKKKV